MQIPKVNINGTPAKDLIDQYEQALESVSAALEALGEITVHGRDYPSQGELIQAMNDHRRNHELLMIVGNRLLEVVVGLSTQNKGS